MNRDDQNLRDLLRSHDPASGMDELSSVECSRMRQVVVSTSVQRAGFPARWTIVAATAAVLAVALGLGLWVIPRQDAEPDRPRRASRPTIARDTVVPAARQVHFSTPGGTRIVWILNPDLQL